MVFCNGTSALYHKKRNTANLAEVLSKQSKERKVQCYAVYGTLE